MRLAIPKGLFAVDIICRLCSVKLAIPDDLFAGVGVICRLYSVWLAIPEDLFAVGVICSLVLRDWLFLDI